MVAVGARREELALPTPLLLFLLGSNAPNSELGVFVITDDIIKFTLKDWHDSSLIA